jgi:methionine--tRNA ligase beta chain
VPESDKLLRCEIDFGDKNEEGFSMTRQIVSGIREYYPEYEQLVGKQLLYIVNLEPRTIRGVESNGMLMAVGEGAPTFLVPEQQVVSGARVR